MGKRLETKKNLQYAFEKKKVEKQIKKAQIKEKKIQQEEESYAGLSNDAFTKAFENLKIGGSRNKRKTKKTRKHKIRKKLGGLRPRPLPPGLVIGEIYNFTERLNNTPMRGQLITINYNTNIHSFFIPGQMGVFQNHPDFPVLRVQQGGSRNKKKTRKKRGRGKKWTRKYKKSINCNNPKGFSQKQYCKYGRRKTRRKR